MAMFKNINLPIETAYCAGILGTAIALTLAVRLYKKVRDRSA